MRDQDKTKAQLISELEELRGQIALLQETGSQARALMETVPLGVTECDITGAITQANPAFEAMTGYSSEELAGMSIADLIADGRQKETLREYFSHLHSEQPPPSPYRCKDLTKDGRLIDVQVDWAYRRNPQGEVSGFISVVSDITQRKLVEQSLHASEERFRKVFEEGPLGVALVTPDSRIQHVNRRFCEMLGYSEEEIIALGIAGITHPEDCRLEDHSRMRLLRGEVPSFTIDKRFVRKDRQVIWGQLTASLMHDAEGRPMALIGMIEDITDRKRAEWALKEANDELERRIEERTAELKKANEQLAVFHTFAESSSQGFCMADLDGRITYVNPTMCRLLGEAAPANVIGTPARVYYQEGVKQWGAQDLPPALERDGCWDGELPLLSRQGTVVPALHHAFLLRDAEGRPFRRCVVVTDISELKQTQQMLRQTCEQLRASQERFELVVRGSGVGIWDWDIRTGKVYYSPRWKALFGYGEDEIGDSFDEWTRLLHPEERDRIIGFQEDFLAGTESTIAAEYRLRHKDGSYRWIGGHGIVVRDERGRACRLVGSHADITDRKLAEEKVQGEQRALRRMVMAGDHERRLITYELHDGAAQQLAAATMLLERRQPKGRERKETEDAYQKGLDALRQATLEVRRVMSWLRTPVLDRFGVVAAIGDVAGQLESMRGAPKIEYGHAVKFKRLEPTLENSLFRIAQEAMTNACRHSKSEKVRVQLTQDSDEVTLEVRDWGTGFDQETVQATRFGLEGIRERCRILGGRVSIRGRPEQGTVIEATFPVIEATSEE